ncbi:MAG: sialate O-acetylesterase, partial [Oscillospiraceae bacterium]|nr:sialate O-acetylesterase [Oscillospiraceae bacterium]
ASAHPRIHLYMTPKATTVEEADALETNEPPAWNISRPESAGPFSAVAWYAARTLANHLPDVHIGVISCCWGGTYAHCWIPREELASFPEGRKRIVEYDVRAGGKSDEEFARELEDYQREVDAWNDRIGVRRKAEPDVTWEVLNEECGLYPWPPPAGRTGFQRPGNLYNAMLARIAPYALRGFWYYQGEQDEDWPEDYFPLLTNLIHRWRQDWEDETKPFLLVQLPMFISKADSLAGDPMRWPVLREAQNNAARTLPGVELAVTADCGEFDNIHPIDKRTPGTRLGLLALETVYRLPVTGRPPVCVSAWQENDAVQVRFDHVGGGLQINGGGFQAAGIDGIFHTADVQVISPDTVRVTASGVSEPASVRYAWYSFGPAGLYGGTGLAAAPLNITI